MARSAKISSESSSTAAAAAHHSKGGKTKSKTAPEILKKGRSGNSKAGKVKTAPKSSETVDDEDDDDAIANDSDNETANGAGEDMEVDKAADASTSESSKPKHKRLVPFTPDQLSEDPCFDLATQKYDDVVGRFVDEIPKDLTWVYANLEKLVIGKQAPVSYVTHNPRNAAVRELGADGKMHRVFVMEGKTRKPKTTKVPSYQIGVFKSSPLHTYCKGVINSILGLLGRYEKKFLTGERKLYISRSFLEVFLKLVHMVVIRTILFAKALAQAKSGKPNARIEGNHMLFAMVNMPIVKNAFALLRDNTPEQALEGFFDGSVKLSQLNFALRNQVSVIKEVVGTSAAFFSVPEDDRLNKEAKAKGVDKYYEELDARLKDHIRHNNVSEAHIDRLIRACGASKDAATVPLGQKVIRNLSAALIKGAVGSAMVEGAVTISTDHLIAAYKRLLC